MRIVFAGTPEFAGPSLRALVTAGHEVVGVITREDAPLGRKRVLTPSAVALAADGLNLNTLKANRLDERATSWVQDLAPDLGVIVAFGGLVREPLLSEPKHGWINLHFSDLPNWRGAAPVQRALMAGQQRLGVTVFRLVAELDAGAVLSRDAFEFDAGTSAGSALNRLAGVGTDALLQAVNLIETDPEAGTPQFGESSYASKLTREDGKLDTQQTSKAVLAHWAGVTPEPGAFMLHEGQPLKLIEVAEVSAGASDSFAEPDVAEIGSVRLQDGSAVLSLTDGALELIRVQPAGKPAMDGAAWLRGRLGSERAVVLV